MTKPLIAVIIALIFFICILSFRTVKLENQVLQCQGEIKDLNNLDLMITNKALEENVKTKVNQIKLIKHDISDADFAEWVQLFKTKRNNQNS